MNRFNKDMDIIFNGEVKDIPTHINMNTVSGFQILPHLDGDDPNKVCVKFISKDGTSRICKTKADDALAFNLTLRDFKDFNDFSSFVCRYFDRYLDDNPLNNLSKLYHDYLYYKSLDSE